MAKDDIYKDQAVTKDFQFNERVAEVFDDMLCRSVPCYQQVNDMTARILARFLDPGDQVYDFGCSTGASLLELARKTEHLDLFFTGYDNSEAMIKKATLKAEMYSKQQRIKFEPQDITALSLENAGAIIMQYTFQFIRPPQRQDFLREINGFLRSGGVLVLSEKTISQDTMLNRSFIDLYLDFKRERGYSEIEISRKREALENVLVPFSIEENRQLLEKSGFSHIETFFQWFNFTSFIAVK